MGTLLEALLLKAFRGNHPVHATLELTYTCNLHCRYCYNPVERKDQTGLSRGKAEAPPLAFEEILSLLDQLRELGVLYLTLTGGEPMLHPKFWEIAFEAKKRAFAIRIFTNGTLIGEREADLFQDLCPNCLEVSAHGASAETAEALNQVPGSYSKYMRALDLLHERGVRVFLKCVVTRLLEGEIGKIRALGEHFGYPVYFDPVLSISDDGFEYALDLAASDDALRQLYGSGEFNLGASPFERVPGEPVCSVASGVLHVDPFGNVMPCVQWREPLGNIRSGSLRTLWLQNPALERIRSIGREVPTALRANTPDRDFCQHCPGLSLSRYGDPLRPDEQNLRVAKIRREIWEKGHPKGDTSIEDP